MVGFAFTDEELAVYSSVNALSKDSQNRHVLVGLSWEETAEHEDFARALRTGTRPRATTQARYTELHGRHLEAARTRRSARDQ